MKVFRVALGLVQSRGSKTVAPGLLTFGRAEEDFIARHVEKVRDLGDASARSRFAAQSPVPGLMQSLLSCSDVDFEAAAKQLQDGLAAQMQGSTSAKDCVFAVVTSGVGGAANMCTVLKLDAVVEAARMEILQTGHVSLKVLKELLPEPGRLQKAVSWPDPRNSSDAITIDTNVSAARYFENAFDLNVSPKSTEAETTLCQILVKEVPPARLAAAYEAVGPLSGPMDGVLDDLVEVGFPELRAASQRVAAEVRPSGLIRPNKISARPVIYRADGAALHVPPHLVDQVEVTPVEDGYLLTLKTRMRPVIEG